MHNGLRPHFAKYCCAGWKGTRMWLLQRNKPARVPAAGGDQMTNEASQANPTKSMSVVWPSDDSGNRTRSYSM